VSNSFTDRLLILFGSPNSMDDDKLIAEYQRLLKSYSAEIVDGAVDRLALKHKYAGWPKIAECVAAAEDELEDRAWKRRAENGGERVESDRVKAANIAASKFINGVGGNGWEWALEFRKHRMVVLAESEGWGRELRAACRRDAFLRFLAAIPGDEPTVDKVMPKRDEDIAYWRREARRTREAAEWRAANPNNKALPRDEPINVAKLLNANRENFEKMQRESPNRRMHMKGATS
jgi:hypothetical protein